jgi:hypothetical protein
MTISEVDLPVYQLHREGYALPQDVYIILKSRHAATKFPRHRGRVHLTCLGQVESCAKAKRKPPKGLRKREFNGQKLQIYEVAVGFR